MILFFDTETTGLHDKWRPFDDECQPYIVQLAAQLFDNDGLPIAGFSVIINNDVHIPKAASDVHGITRELAEQRGISSDLAIDLFAALYAKCSLLCAHNMKFDKLILETAIARRWGRYKALSKPLFCTMEAAAGIVDLPPTERMLKYGFNKPKAPKLAECIRFFFDEDLEGAHDALVDVSACARLFFHLMGMGLACDTDSRKGRGDFF